MGAPALVTVLAVCYNHERFVVECLDAIRAQDYPHLQIIVIDDCSRDGSVRVIREWIAANGIDCQFIAHEKNQGVCRTLNEGVRLARGQYISLIATDDYWMPDKISRQVALMEMQPDDVGVCYSDAHQIDEHGHRLPKMFIEEHRSAGPLDGDLLDALVAGNFIPAMTTLIRRSVFERVGLYDEGLVFEDFDFWLRAAARFRFAYCSEPLACYRVLATSMVRAVLWKETPAVQHTYFRIHEKTLAEPRISDASRTLATTQFLFRARKLYETGHPHPARALWAAYRRSGSASDLRMALSAALGISHRRYARAWDYVQWRFSRHAAKPEGKREGPQEGPRP